MFVLRLNLADMLVTNTPHPRLLTLLLLDLFSQIWFSVSFLGVIPVETIAKKCVPLISFSKSFLGFP